MQGIELARSFYEEYGRPMLEEEFSDCLDRIAVGLVGHGSECFGFDDALSADHDYQPGFCLWITEEDDEKFGFSLMRAYRKLPKEFQGFRLQEESGLGSGNQGKHTISEFYGFYIGDSDGFLTNEQWLSIPDEYLAEATNGQVFADPLGEFTRIREQLLYGCPEDVWKKKLASALFYMAQRGQYNYRRCLEHGQKAAAAVCLTDFARNTAYAAFALNRKFAPYYKWTFRAMEDLPLLGELVPTLNGILETPFDAEKNCSEIETVCREVLLATEKVGHLALPAQLTDVYLEPYAYQINEGIKDGNLRNSPIML